MADLTGGREDLRRRYRPAQVRLLFVGESPPASGRFFYNRDSGLYRAILQAFQQDDPSISTQTFLKVFQTTGCYLIDLCAEPVDRMDTAARKQACRLGEPSLVRSLTELKPQVIITVVRSIEANVIRAGRKAGWSGTFLHLPYPGRWVRSKAVFVEDLAGYLRSRA
jgi:hypothetical protein